MKGHGHSYCYISCEVCEYSLSLNPVLRNILKITQNKKYFCAVCGEWIYIKAHLKRHGGGSHSQPHSFDLRWEGLLGEPSVCAVWETIGD